MWINFTRRPTNFRKNNDKQRGKMVAEPTALYAVPTSPKEYQQQIKKLEQQMYKFAQDLDFCRHQKFAYHTPHFLPKR